MAKKLRSEQVDLANYYNKTESTPLIQGSNITITETEEGVVISSSGGGGGGSSDWEDIANKPATFAPSAHNHAAGEITSGTLAVARIPTGTTASTVALGNHGHTVANISGLSDTLDTLGDSIDNASTLVAGTNITLTPSGNTLTISAADTVYDWTWLQQIPPPSGTCTQQQYNELLAAAQTGKIFPQAVSVNIFTVGEDEVAVMVSAMQSTPYGSFIANWAVFPNLDVEVIYVDINTTTFEVVTELPATPTEGVFYFVKE